MRAPIAIFLCVVFAASACSKSNERVFTLQGQVLSVGPARKQLTVKHEEIKGFMPAMTMPYEVRDETLLKGIAAGDLINATLVVVSNGAYLSAIKKVGEAPLEKPAHRLNADLSRWTFLTGDRDEIDRFAARFGVSISRAINDARDITHNLRTVVIGADGRIVKVYTGNDWAPDQILADLKNLG